MLTRIEVLEQQQRNLDARLRALEKIPKEIDYSSSHLVSDRVEKLEANQRNLEERLTTIEQSISRPVERKEERTAIVQRRPMSEKKFNSNYVPVVLIRHAYANSGAQPVYSGFMQFLEKMANGRFIVTTNEEAKNIQCILYVQISSGSRIGDALEIQDDEVKNAYIILILTHNAPVGLDDRTMKKVNDFFSLFMDDNTMHKTVRRRTPMDIENTNRLINFILK